MAEKINVAFAASGDTQPVPDNSAAGEVSWDTGYGPDYSKAKTVAGYRFIERASMNEIFNVLSSNTKEWQDQLFPEHQATTDYPIGMITKFNGLLYQKGSNDNGAISDPSSDSDWDAYKTEREKLKEKAGNHELSFSTNPREWQIPATGDAEFSRTTDDVLWQFAQDNNLVVSQALKDADPFQYSGKYGDGDGATTFTTPDLRSVFLRGAPQGVEHGETQMDAMLRIQGGIEDVYAGGGVNATVAFTRTFIGAIQYGTGSVGASANSFTFDSSNAVRTDDENRPKTLNITPFINRGKIL